MLSPKVAPPADRVGAGIADDGEGDPVERARREAAQLANHPERGVVLAHHVLARQAEVRREAEVEGIDRQVEDRDGRGEQREGERHARPEGAARGVGSVVQGEAAHPRIGSK